ncbi:MAG: L-histidine N(alpha)-methyltransferase [Polyangia bacterium]
MSRNDPPKRSTAPERPRPLNCLLTPHRRLAREAAELPHTLRAARSALRPVWAYLGPASAEAYRLYTRRCPDAPERADSLGALAAALRPFLRTEPLEVLALGAGEGQQEVRLAAHLLRDLARPATLALVDLSEPLLSSAYARAAAALPHVELWALLADLEELSTYSDLLYVPGRQRVVLLLGGTFGELDDELRFVRYGLSFCTAGDLLVLDVPLSAGGDDAVRRKRQGAAAQQRLDAAAAWLNSALSPYSGGEPLAWSLRLDSREGIPGSYSWTAVASGHTPSQPCAIELWRCKHYESAPLIEQLYALGWEHVAACAYAGPLPGELQAYRRRETP